MQKSVNRTNALANTLRQTSPFTSRQYAWNDIGVVHTHGSWLSGVSHTMRTVFSATEDDTLYVIGDPGWITGQSYLIAAPLVQGMTTVIAEGSPLFPHAGRFSSIIERYKVTLFKAGSTFLKAVMTDPASAREMQQAVRDYQNGQFGTLI